MDDEPLSLAFTVRKSNDDFRIFGALDQFLDRPRVDSEVRIGKFSEVSARYINTVSVDSDDVSELPSVPGTVNSQGAVFVFNPWAKTPIMAWPRSTPWQNRQ